jgi:metal-responsive CopG/Arc/MetJ family transcriptional regulator
MRANRKTERLQVECAPAILETVETAAKRRFVTKSEYVRQALLEQLHKDGLTPVAA